jgi:DNA polymerase I-like protein with 3'-5' exonuclease and polymerase domains
MCAVAAMEHTGIPIDEQTFNLLKSRWQDIQEALIRDIDDDFGVYEGRSFKAGRFAEWLTKTGLPWKHLESGALALDDETFRSMARAYPVVAPLRELRHALGEMRLNAISVGADGRNRTLISPFQSRTGRNQPSNSRFIFGAAVWLRGLIKPAEGMAIAYLDFSSQEIAIAAALSGDVALWRAYESGDPYIQFAIDAGLAPAGATKATHGAIRSKCKTVVLGTQYGMSAHGVAAAAGMTVAEARQMLIPHRETYRVFWKWAEANVDRGLLGGVLTTPFGWQYRLDKDQSPNPRSLLNWPMQAGGADMLRLACTRIVKGGIRLCAPVHDAILIEAPVKLIDRHVEDAREAMAWASSMVLGGRSCRVEADVYAYPDRYMDAERGAQMWNRVMKLVGGPIWNEKPGLAHPA